MYRLFLILLMMISSFDSIYSQNRTIKGLVIDESFESIISAEIIINDSINVGKTGTDGRFQFETPLTDFKLKIMYVGMEEAELEITEGCNNIELIMMDDMTYCFLSPKKVDKDRRKRFNNIPKLHKEAYDKGIFQSPDICYSRKFREFSK